MKRNAKIVLFAVLFCSLGGNIYQFVKTLDIPLGLGKYKDSPDGKYTALANCFKQGNPLRADYKQLHGEFCIRDSKNRSDQDNIIAVRLVPPGTDGELGYYDMPEIITWSADSKQATFTVPGAICTLDVEPQKTR